MGPVAGTPALRGGEADAGIRQFLTDQGLADAKLRRVPTGRNNRVWVIESLRGRRVLKQYRQSTADVRDRLSSEYRFLELLHVNGIERVPEPIAHDRDRNLALYSFLPGTPVGKVTRDHIDQSVEFLGQVNRLRADPSARTLPPASDACFSIGDHLDNVRARVVLLLSPGIKAGIHEQARALVEARFVPAFDRIETAIIAGFRYSDLKKRLIEDDRVLSPSDFGFHNALESEGVLQFLDFEYAGWDDPVKLVCDFLCQPDLPLDLEFAQYFVQRMNVTLDSEEITERVELLLPLHRLKWCCIILNGFREAEWSDWSSAGTVEVDVLRSQLEKAAVYFDDHLARA